MKHLHHLQARRCYPFCWEPSYSLYLRIAKFIGGKHCSLSNFATLRLFIYLAWKWATAVPDSVAGELRGLWTYPFSSDSKYDYQEMNADLERDQLTSPALYLTSHTSLFICQFIHISHRPHPQNYALFFVTS